MPTALLADDEPLLREDLRDKLRLAWPELVVVAEAGNGVEAATLLARHVPDVAFLDIKMPGETGLDVAADAARAALPTRVVFVTAYDQFAIEAFERAAVDYLLKPASLERLAQTVARLKAALAAPVPTPDLARLLALLREAAGADAERKPPLRWIRASRGDTTFQIAVDEVLYFQSDDKYTIVHTANGEHVIRLPLADLVATLDGEQFWQVHRGTVVNVRLVTSSRRDGDGRVFLNLKGVARPLAVSRAYQHLFKQM